MQSTGELAAASKVAVVDWLLSVKWPLSPSNLTMQISIPNYLITRMWANAERDGRPAEHRWRPLFNAAKFG